MRESVEQTDLRELWAVGWERAIELKGITTCAPNQLWLPVLKKPILKKEPNF